MSNGTTKCVYCGKSFIKEEWRSHPCVKDRHPLKEIVIDFSYETETADGNKTIHAYDLKGNIYRLTKPNPTKLVQLKSEASDESKQEDYSEWFRREGNSSNMQSSYTPYILTGFSVDECLRPRQS